MAFPILFTILTSIRGIPTLHSVDKVSSEHILNVSYNGITPQSHDTINYLSSAEVVNDSVITDDFLSVYPFMFYDNKRISASAALYEDMGHAGQIVGPPRFDDDKIWSARESRLTNANQDAIGTYYATKRKKLLDLVANATHISEQENEEDALATARVGDKDEATKVDGLWRRRSVNNVRRHLADASKLLAELPREKQEDRVIRDLAGTPLPDVDIASPSVSANVLEQLKFAFPVVGSFNAAVNSEIQFLKSLDRALSVQPDSPQLDLALKQLTLDQQTLLKSLKNVSSETALFVPRTISALAGHKLPGEDWFRHHLVDNVNGQSSNETAPTKSNGKDGDIFLDQSSRGYVYHQGTWWTCESGQWVDFETRKPPTVSDEHFLNERAGQCEDSSKRIQSLTLQLTNAIGAQLCL